MSSTCRRDPGGQGGAGAPRSSSEERHGIGRWRTPRACSLAFADVREPPHPVSAPGQPATLRPGPEAMRCIVVGAAFAGVPQRSCLRSSGPQTGLSTVCRSADAADAHPLLRWAALLMQACGGQTTPKRPTRMLTNAHPHNPWRYRSTNLGGMPSGSSAPSAFTNPNAPRHRRTRACCRTVIAPRTVAARVCVHAARTFVTLGWVERV